MRCLTWKGNDLTKLNRQVQLWVCPRFEPPTPHLCISYTGREPVYFLSFIPSASCKSNSGIALGGRRPCLQIWHHGPHNAPCVDSFCSWATSHLFSLSLHVHVVKAGTSIFLASKNECPRCHVMFAKEIRCIR